MERGEDREREERRGEARRGEVIGMKMKGLLTLPNYEVTVSVAVPEGVLDSVRTARTTNLASCAIKKSKYVVKIGGDVARNGEMRRSSEL